MALDSMGKITLKCFLLGVLILAVPHLSYVNGLLSYVIVELWPLVLVSYAVGANALIFLLYREEEYQVSNIIWGEPEGLYKAAYLTT